MADSNGKGEPPDGARNPLEHLRDIIGVPIDDDFADIPTPTRWPDIPSRHPPLLVAAQHPRRSAGRLARP
jgi:hypothetical protein